MDLQEMGREREREEKQFPKLPLGANPPVSPVCVDHKLAPFTFLLAFTVSRPSKTHSENVS